jgi:hypothetical protein
MEIDSDYARDPTASVPAVGQFDEALSSNEGEHKRVIKVLYSDQKAIRVCRHPFTLAPVRGRATRFHQWSGAPMIVDCKAPGSKDGSGKPRRPRPRSGIARCGMRMISVRVVYHQKTIVVHGPSVETLAASVAVTYRAQDQRQPAFHLDQFALGSDMPHALVKPVYIG